jgi:predicted GNAT family acetyltransferase
VPVTVTDVPELGRYEARIDGDVAGFAEYQRKGHLVVFTHTEVNSDQQGKGVAGTLARDVLDDVRRRGERALLRCPFLSQWVSHHPEYADLLVHREAGDAPG